MKYRVGMIQRVWEEADVYVDAASPEEAEQKAIKMANHGDDATVGLVRWRFLENDEDYPREVTGVFKLGE